ncbi:MAG: hypothetical protein M3040_08935 [Bacteroidota bacterium]|nr:hypothetical protein [Bacteroidota bacterium]
MVVSEIKLHELLKSKIGEREAEAFIQILETKVDTRLSEKTTVFLTKEDIARLDTKISEAKVDTIKRMVATAVAIVGLTVALVKLS